MATALRRRRPERALGSARTIALASGTVAPFVRRPAASAFLDDRRPDDRLEAALDVPAVSRIVLRPLTLR